MRYAGQLRRGDPVLYRQAIDAAELAFVVGHQHPAFSPCVGGYPKVVVANGLPRTLQRTADLTLVLACRLGQWHHLDGALQLL